MISDIGGEDNAVEDDSLLNTELTQSHTSEHTNAHTPQTCTERFLEEAHGTHSSQMVRGHALQRRKSKRASQTTHNVFLSRCWHFQGTLLSRLFPPPFVFTLSQHFGGFSKRFGT